MWNKKKTFVYFAFPKCGSEWVRAALDLVWKNDYKENSWDACDIGYCHVRPLRFLKHYAIDEPEKMIHTHIKCVTLVRNTYERLVSAWNYGVQKKFDYVMVSDATDKNKKKKKNRALSFAEFIDRIYENRENFEKIPMFWMILPVERYFEGVLDRIMFFKIEDENNHGYFSCFLRERGENPEVLKKEGLPKNSMKHEPHTAYYTDDIKKKVDDIYAYEINRFGYNL